jgi:hypothetical protein
MRHPPATVALTLLWLRCRYPTGIPPGLTDQRILSEFYAWVEKNRGRDPRVSRLLRQRELEAAAPWN